jgi:quercetin dioxygenase-like cupin family protein
MRKARLEDMKGGWFVGNFSPVVCKTDAAEVAVKHYAAGQAERRHYHKIATEVTVIVAGEVEMNGARYAAGDILVIEPNEVTDFKALTNATTAVVKIPGALNDKYMEQTCSTS